MPKDTGVPLIIAATDACARHRSSGPERPDDQYPLRSQDGLCVCVPKAQRMKTGERSILSCAGEGLRKKKDPIRILFHLLREEFLAYRYATCSAFTTNGACLTVQVV
jgi:hypothetical protein